MASLSALGKCDAPTLLKTGGQFLVVVYHGGLDVYPVLHGLRFSEVYLFREAISLFVSIHFFLE